MAPVVYRRARLLRARAPIGASVDLGVSVLCDDPIRPGTRLELDITLPAGTIQDVIARVAHIRHADPDEGAAFVLELDVLRLPVGTWTPLVQRLGPAPGQGGAPLLSIA
jgi:hypothetical protein